MPIKITRTLYVGLGGTGAKSILRTKKCFIDAYGEVPPMVAFLAIDTDTDIKNLNFTSRNGKSVKFDDNEICFCGIKGSAVAIVNQNPTQYQWLPPRNKQNLNNLMGTGAGQVRSNGRFLARYNANNIQNLIANKVAHIARPLPPGCQFTYDTNQDNVEYPTKVNIVGSVAGGTGSGMLLDMLVLTSKALQTTGFDYVITPWVVLPDVFRLMHPGVPSANVFQNAYGAIRELDFLFHLPNDNQNPLDFHFAQINYLDEKIFYAYLINNTNSAGVTFQHIDELAESIGRCLFLPANEIGRGTATIEDNLRSAKDSGCYNINNKGGHYSSVGSAEIVYDNQAIGNVIARGIIGKICSELCRRNTTDILSVVNAWTKSEAVAIQEHEADQLIDSILTKYAPVNVVIEKDSDANIVNAYIQAGALAENVKSEATQKTNEKFVNVKAQLLKQVQLILNSQNGVGQAKDFLESLLDNISICKKEMNDEALKLQQILAYPINWESEISTLRKSFGPIKMFDRDAADILQTKISEHIAQHRDLLRHNLAIQFFTNLDVYANELLEKINVFKINLEAVERKQRSEIQNIQHLAQSTSHFEIYLHSDEVCSCALPDISETSALLRSKVKIYELIHKTQNELNELFFDFAKEHQNVVAAVNVTIEDKMASMPEDKLKEVFARAKVMSTPLWTIKPHPIVDVSQELTSMFFIGVNNNSSSIISEKYQEEFKTGIVKPTFASTYQTDRISIFQIQCCTPAITVNNMYGYMSEAEFKYSREQFPVYYLDAQWHQRMLDAGFDLEPHQPQDTVLPNWINAIVYGFIKYDETKNTYYMNSMIQGDRLRGGFLALGQRRDQAFEQFELRRLYGEIEERMTQMRVNQGNPAVNQIIRKVKENLANYVSDYAQLSQTEQNRIEADDQAYQMVSNLLIREVTYLNDLVL